jgi:hypothetical protein
MYTAPNIHIVLSSDQQERTKSTRTVVAVCKHSKLPRPAVPVHLNDSRVYATVKGCTSSARPHAAAGSELPHAFVLVLRLHITRDARAPCSLFRHKQVRTQELFALDKDILMAMWFHSNKEIYILQDRLDKQGPLVVVIDLHFPLFAPAATEQRSTAATAQEKQ